MLLYGTDIATDVDYWLTLFGRIYKEIWKHKWGPTSKLHMQKQMSQVFHALLKVNKNLQHPSFSCTRISNFQSEVQFKVQCCLKANPLLTIMQHKKANSQWWGDVLAESQLPWTCQLPPEMSAQKQDRHFSRKTSRSIIRHPQTGLQADIQLPKL